MRARLALCFRRLRPALCGFGCLVLAGCVQTRQSEPKRTAVEQLLLSRAAAKSMDAADLSPVAGRRVYVDVQRFESVDKAYVASLIRERAARAGALLCDDRADCELVLEPRAAALSIDSSASLLGLPEIPVPVPLAGTFLSPEVPFFKSEKQYSTAKIGVFAYDQSGAFVFAAGEPVGRSHHHYYRFLGFIQWTATDLPEKRILSSE